jgi:hypothetical protein
VEIADCEAGENASFQSAVDSQMSDRGIVVEVMAGDAENNRPMKDHDEREESEQGTASPPSPGATPLIEAVTEFIHAASNLFPRG